MTPPRFPARAGPHFRVPPRRRAIPDSSPASPCSAAQAAALVVLGVLAAVGTATVLLALLTAIVAAHPPAPFR